VREHILAAPSMPGDGLVSSGDLEDSFGLLALDWDSLLAGGRG